MNGRRIYPSKQIRYLGIYLDETLNFNYHCKILSKRLKRANGILCKARHYLDIPNLKNLYYAIFSSHISYGCQIWAQDTNCHNKTIFSLQKKALRIITFSCYSEPSLPLLSQLKVLKLADEVKLKNCMFVYKALNKMLPLCFHDYFKLTKELHEINTRNAGLGCVQINQSNTVRYGLNSVTKKCIDDWNFFCLKFINGLNSFSHNQAKSSITSYFLISYHCF